MRKHKNITQAKIKAMATLIEINGNNTIFTGYSYI